jgi:hypothetical protein
LACHLQLDADPDPVYHFDADTDPEATFQFDANPDPQHCRYVKTYREKLSSSPSLQDTNIPEKPLSSSTISGTSSLRMSGFPSSMLFFILKPEQNICKE